jgi:hydrogenase maturation factor HypF (carbamoyltransferase family)
MQPQILSDRAKPESANYISNLSTLIHKQPLNDSMINVSKGHNSGLIDKRQLKFKLKRAGTSGGVATNKLMLKGVDKIIKENLKKVKTKEEE